MEKQPWDSRPTPSVKKKGPTNLVLRFVNAATHYSPGNGALLQGLTPLWRSTTLLLVANFR